MVDVLLDGNQLLKLAGNDAIIKSYPELYNYDSVEDLFSGGINKIIILYLNEKDGNSMSGHWCLLTKYKNIVDFFDPYGLMPDSEIDWNSKEDRIKLNQNKRYLTKLLYNYDGKVNYNEMRFQKKDKNINTCGRHTGLRAHFYKIPLTKYQNMFKKMREKGFDLDRLAVYISNMFLEE